jgi:uncharacterized protein
MITVMAVVAVLAGMALAFFIYAVLRYTPVIVRVFREQPVLKPLRHEAEFGHEDVRFLTKDGLELAGTYFHTRRHDRAGVVVFCHEFLGDRWSALPYADCLRDLGFDLFSFDFRNHGDSDREEGYDPLQWVSDRETKDLEAALECLRARSDHDPAGFGLFGISRGGGAAIVVGAETPDVWGVVTDGAFPTDGMILAYILKWAPIYVSRIGVWKYLPTGVYAAIGRMARRHAERQLNRVFVSIERGASRLAPRPLLMIHGARDSLIKPEVARELFERVKEPKDFWLVPEAKHNGGRDQDPDGYRAHIESFFRQWAPRRLGEIADSASEGSFDSDPALQLMVAQSAAAV